MNRRELLKGLMAGGMIVAGELWMPGQKLISIPSGQVFGNEYGINSMFQMIDRNTVRYVGSEDKIVSVAEFIKWLKSHASHMLKSTSADMMVSLNNGFRMENPWHLSNGSLAQDSPREEWMNQSSHREIYQHTGDFVGEDFFVDKVYTDEFDNPRERHTESDTGHRGYR